MQGNVHDMSMIDPPLNLSQAPTLIDFWISA